MSDEQQSAILGTTATVRTLVDGGMRITIDIAPADMKRAFELFGMSGTNVAIARVTQVAAQSHTQRAAMREMAAPGYGKAWQALHRAGWFHNPRVSASFGAANIDPDRRPEFIKEMLREEFDVESMSEVPPDRFREYLIDRGIADTLPAAFMGAV